MSGRYVLACVSDTHCGSILGLCPPEGVEFDTGAKYLPSKAQSWQWEKWVDFWTRARAVADHERAKLVTLYVGDLTDGDHHNTSQTISRNPEQQFYIAFRVVDHAKEIARPHRIYVVRGTEVHTGPESASENALARLINASRGETSQEWSTWHLRLRVGGVLVDAQHHGRMGTRPWTRGSALQTLGMQIYIECCEAGDPIPDLAVRADRHQYGYSGRDMGGVPVLQLPAWQLKTAFAHRVAPESRAAVGGVLVRIAKGRVDSVEPILYRPTLPVIRELP
jgi:hypothetical protein